MTRPVKHFMAIDLSALRRFSFRQVTLAFLGTGTMVVCLKQLCVTGRVRDRLIMSVKPPTSWSAHALSMHPGIPSGPAVLRMLTCLKVLFASATESEITHSIVRERMRGLSFLTMYRREKLLSQNQKHD